MNEDLRTWFRQKWVRMDTKGEIKGPCAREDGEGKPKCLPAAKARSMSKQDRATAARRKRREDPVADRKGKGNKPVMVNTEEFIPEGNEPTNPALWSRAKAMAKKKFDVYPSAYANGWAAKYYKSKGGGWRSVSEESVEEACWKGYKRVGMKKKGDRMVPNCVPEAREIIEKAKAKMKKDPLTGAKIDKDRFILPEEQELEESWGVRAQNFSSFKDGVQDWADNHTHNGKVDVKTHVVNAGGKKWHQTTASHKGVIVGTFNHTGNGKSEEGHGRHAHWSDNVHEELEEALTRVTSGNKGYGYHGNVEARDEEERDKRYSAMHRHAKNLLMSKGHLQDAKKPNVMVKHFLDSAHGRHIADNPTDKNITSRFSEFKKKYDPAMHEEVELEEKRGLWDNIHAKRKRIKAGSGERMRKPGSEGAPSAADLRASQTEEAYSKINPKHEAGLKSFSSKETAMKHAKKMEDKGYLTRYSKGSTDYRSSQSHYPHQITHYFRDNDHKNEYRRQKYAEKKKIKEEKELEEAHGMWKVDFPKQHAGKAVAAGSVHVKAQNTAHAHKVAAKRVGVDHKMFKSKVTKSSILPEEKDDMPWHEDPKNPTRKSGERKDEYGNKIKNVAKHLAKKAMKANVKEELGKDNEWGRPELRKKFAAMTPGQEGMAADKIPTFDPRYDDVTTQHLGLHPVREGYLAEISAKGAEARAKFQARVQKVLADPANIKRAKKAIAKKKAEEKAKEPAHLVMQLRKAVSIGSKVHFQDGSHHTIAPNHADVFMSKYNSAKSAIEKEALQKRAHKSHSEFMKTIAEAVHENCGTPDCCQMCDTAEMGTHHVDSYEAHKGSGDQISPVISHDDDDIRFSDFDETEFEKELEADVLALSWEDLVDLYDEDEIEYVDSPEKEDDEEEEDLEEAITPAGRLKKKFNAMRTKSRRMMARNIAIKRVSTPEKIKSRSIRAARRMVYKRLLRNRDISTVSAAEKTRLEAQVKRMAPMVARLSVRVMPAVRKLEQSRIKNSRTRKK